MKDLKKEYRGKICTFSGVEFDVARPNIEDINIHDIAHALSNMPRWGAHSPHFFSVAQHSELVRQLLIIHFEAPHLAFAGLMHDASEAYMMDIPSTLKPLIPTYKPLEKKLQELIFNKYGIDWPMDPLIKKADTLALEIEWNNLMISRRNSLNCAPFMPIIEVVMSPRDAEERFIETFCFHAREDAEEVIEHQKSIRNTKLEL